MEVMHMLYVCVLCTSCGSSQCCILHNLPFVHVGRGCKPTIWKRAYSRAGLMTALYVAMSVSFCLSHPVAVSDFVICRGLCASTEKL